MPPRLSVYMSELDVQSRIAVRGAQALDELLASEPVDSESVFYVIQQILGGAAMMSKQFWADTNPRWPEERKRFALDRAEALRKYLNPSPILKRRAVRNSIEHLDERLDQLYFQDDRASIAQNVMGPIGQVISGGPNLNIIREFDPATGEYRVLGDQVLLVDVIHAMHEVGERARAWSDIWPPPDAS